MAWVVDTCLLIDIAEADPSFGEASAELLDLKRTDGLAVCPVTYVELAPVFDGDWNAQDEFLLNLGVAWPEAWTTTDTIATHEGWHRYVLAKRAGQMTKSPIADVMIGAFASRFDGILTRNDNDFRSLFPKLEIAMPQLMPKQ